MSLAGLAKSVAGIVPLLALVASIQGCTVKPAVTLGDEGEPIPVDSQNPRYKDYLARVREMIRVKWHYPCVKDEATGRCEYKNAKLVILFGLLKDGRVVEVQIQEPSGHGIYDESAVNAIKAASPFPPVPPSLMETARPGSTGVRITAAFTYQVDRQRLGE